MTITSLPFGLKGETLQQGIKWAVYLLLAINFVPYLQEDWHAMLNGMPPNPTWLDWTGNFATSMDVVAWLSLLILFEIETYVLADDSVSLSRILQGVRVLCYLVLGHTLYTYIDNVAQINEAVLRPGVSGLCQLADQGVSYLWNLVYTEVNSDNCAALGQGHQWYRIYNDEVVTDVAGLALDLRLAHIDVIEVVAWFGIMAMLELDVRLQERGITGGRMMTVSRFVKLALYLVLVALSVYWLSIDHPLYAWDEFLWIAGFAAIEMNMSEWREEIKDESSAAGAVEA